MDENQKKYDEKQDAKEKHDRRMLKPLVETKIIRILSRDIPGEKKVYVGLTHLKGISWSFSNALCKKLNINKNKKIEELSESEIKKIEEFIKNPQLPAFLLNRRKDYDSGEDKHLNTSQLDLQKEFDIKRLKKIKSYKGLRHMHGQPVRGQRTKSHFRSNRKKGGAVGVVKKKEPAKKAAAGGTK